MDSTIHVKKRLHQECREVNNNNGIQGQNKWGQRRRAVKRRRRPQVRASVLNPTLHALLPFSLHVAPMRAPTKAVECIYFLCVKCMWVGGWVGGGGE